MMKAEIAALFVGAIFGAAVRVLNLPTPAPPRLSGVLAIFGIWIGYKIAQPAAKYFPNVL